MNDAVKKAAAILAGTPMCFIGTVSGNEPKVRPFQFQFEQDGKLWFCTAKSKDVYKQVQANPAVEICAVKQDMTTLRISGKVVFDDDRAVKERILAEQELIRNIYKSADNPDFTTFYVNHGTYTVFDFSGNPPRTESF
ncbi:pyridoxamine 5'-phosphate oxidase family protein [Desulfovibrio sp. OttesenSCG-928-O18]|nr:pyridoxamine 5'-phosphate oxidase family protein [Desulfovibrio sp. OttesenSCG-928-O18]